MGDEICAVCECEPVEPVWTGGEDEDGGDVPGSAGGDEDDDWSMM